MGNIAGIMEGCPPQFRNNIYHVSNTLCAIFIRGQFNPKVCEFPEIPNKAFTVDILIEDRNEDWDMSKSTSSNNLTTLLK